MSYHLPPVNWLRAFEAAARHASFAAAAGELALTSAAVSHQVRSLESFLGYPLFERLPRGLRLTDLGKAYLGPVRSAFDALSISTAGLFGIRGETTLVVRVPISFAVMLLGPWLGDFSRDHPAINLRLVSAIWADALPADKVDVDIRFGQGRWDGFHATPLLSEPSVVICHPSRCHEKLGDLTANRLIDIMGLEYDWLRLFEAKGLKMPPGSSRATVDTSLTAIELVAADMGCAIVLRSYAQSTLARGRVAIMPGAELTQPQAHFLLTRQGGGQQKPEVMVFEHWLAQRMRALEQAPGGTRRPPAGPTKSKRLRS
jgi:LysR family glycine cleavage system transcriptional activator